MPPMRGGARALTMRTTARGVTGFTSVRQMGLRLSSTRAHNPSSQPCLIGSVSLLQLVLAPAGQSCTAKTFGLEALA